MTRLTRVSSVNGIVRVNGNCARAARLVAAAEPATRAANTAEAIRAVRLAAADCYYALGLLALVAFE